MLNPLAPSCQTPRDSCVAPVLPPFFPWHTLGSTGPAQGSGCADGQRELLVVEGQDLVNHEMVVEVALATLTACLA